MASQLYWFELLLKASAGLSLLVAPVTLARILGLPHGGTGFWMRILGCLLLGVAAGIYIEATQTSAGGLGFAALAVLNVAGIIAFFGLIMTNQVKSWRGTISLWGCVGILLVLTLFEIAYA